jgi:hypothetical protein
MRRYTVACAEHGEMEHQPRVFGWVCTVRPCCTYLADADVFHLVASGSGDPVPVVVSDHCMQRAAELLGAVQGADSRG